MVDPPSSFVHAHAHGLERHAHNSDRAVRRRSQVYTNKATCFCSDAGVCSSAPLLCSVPARPMSWPSGAR